MTAIAGGTVSSISGGKFANGAVSVAFVMMYNDMAHEVQGSRLLKKQREDLMKSAKDAHLTLEEANNWYRYGGGKPIYIDGSNNWRNQ
jgi:hypothetical protein